LSAWAAGPLGRRQTGSAGDPFPTLARQIGDRFDSLPDHVPVHHSLPLRRGSRRYVRNISNPDGQGAADEYPENQTHTPFTELRGGRVGDEGGAIVF
jgi:hypothetical protein